MKKKETDIRTDNIELLRIVAAALILLNHIGVTSDALATANQFLLDIFHLGGKFGVDVFVVISVYFLRKREGLQYKKIFRVIFEIFVDGTILNGIYMIWNHRLLSLTDFIHGYIYWFPWAYVIMLFFLPAITNVVKGKLEQITIWCGGIWFFCLCLYGTLFDGGNIYHLLVNEMIMGPIWFIYMYVLVSYLFREKNDMIASVKWPIFWAILCYCGMFIIVKLSGHSAIRDMNSPLCLLGASLLFVGFHRIKVPQNKAVEWFAKGTFGTYIIQTHFNMGPIWSSELFRYNEHASNISFIYKCCITTILFFFIFSGILAQGINWAWKKITSYWYPEQQ